MTGRAGNSQHLGDCDGKLSSAGDRNSLSKTVAADIRSGEVCVTPIFRVRRLAEIRGLIARLNANISCHARKCSSLLNLVSSRIYRSDAKSRIESHYRAPTAGIIVPVERGVTIGPFHPRMKRFTKSAQPPVCDRELSGASQEQTDLAGLPAPEPMRSNPSPLPACPWATRRSSRCKRQRSSL